MTREELEFSISQYLDGTLDEDRRDALEARLAADPEAQEILREERALTTALHGLPALPPVRWDALSDRISGAIDAQLEERVEQASWAMRLRSPRFLALAASVVLAAAVSLKLITGSQQGGGSGVPPVQPTPARWRWSSRARRKNSRREKWLKKSPSAPAAVTRKPRRSRLTPRKSTPAPRAS